MKPMSCSAKFQRPRKDSGTLASGSTPTLRPGSKELANQECLSRLFRNSYTLHTHSLSRICPGQSHFSNPIQLVSLLGLIKGPLENCVWPEKLTWRYQAGLLAKS